MSSYDDSCMCAARLVCVYVHMYIHMSSYDDSRMCAAQFELKKKIHQSKHCAAINTIGMPMFHVNKSFHIWIRYMFKSRVTCDTMSDV